MTILLTAFGKGKGWQHGYDLMKATGLSSGTLYPLLVRLTRKGLLEAEWQAPVQPGRPARHAYRLTAAGMALVLALHDEMANDRLESGAVRGVRPA